MPAPQQATCPCCPATQKSQHQAGPGSEQKARGIMGVAGVGRREDRQHIQSCTAPKPHAESLHMPPSTPSFPLLPTTITEFTLFSPHHIRTSSGFPKAQSQGCSKKKTPKTSDSSKYSNSLKGKFIMNFNNSERYEYEMIRVNCGNIYSMEINSIVRSIFK